MTIKATRDELILESQMKYGQLCDYLKQKYGTINANINGRNGFDYTHLINVSGPHDSVGFKSFDELPTLNIIHVEYISNKEISTIELVPEHKEIVFDRVDNKYSFDLEQINLYTICK